MKFIAYIFDYFRRLVDGNDGGASMRRFIVIVISFHFILASFLILFGMINSKVDKELLRVILDNDFIIILSGLGLIGASNIAEIMVKRYVAAGSVLFTSEKTKTTTIDGGTGEEADDIKIETVKTEVQETKTE